MQTRSQTKKTGLKILVESFLKVCDEYYSKRNQWEINQRERNEIGEMLQQSPQHATNCALKLNIMFKKEEKTTLLMLETAMGLEYHLGNTNPIFTRSRI